MLVCVSPVHQSVCFLNLSVTSSVFSEFTSLKKNILTYSVSHLLFFINAGLYKLITPDTSGASCVFSNWTFSDFESLYPSLNLLVPGFVLHLLSFQFCCHINLVCKVSLFLWKLLSFCIHWSKPSWNFDRIFWQTKPKCLMLSLWHLIFFSNFNCMSFSP